MKIGRKRKSAEEQLEEKRAKKRGRQQKATASTNVDFVRNPCHHCHSDTHRSSSSKLCPNHTKSTEELLQEAVGKNFEYMTRKCSLQKAIKAPYRDGFHSKVIHLCEYVRSVIILTQMLANAFILTNSDFSPYCFTQNYFYSLTQIVREERVSSTNSKLPLNELNQVWENLKAAHPTIARLWVAKPTRSSDAISEACVTLATNYSSNIVENFEARVTSYLRYKISRIFPVRLNVIDRRRNIYDICQTFFNRRCGKKTVSKSSTSMLSPALPECQKTGQKMSNALYQLSQPLIISVQS